MQGLSCVLLRSSPTHFSPRRIHLPFPEEWGHRPVEMPLVIVRGQDFAHIIDIDPSQQLPAGTASRIELVNNKKSLITTWEGVVSPLQIDFAVESEETDPLPNGLSYYLYVVYPDTPDLDICLTYGSVERI